MCFLQYQIDWFLMLFLFLKLFSEQEVLAPQNPRHPISLPWLGQTEISVAIISAPPFVIELVASDGRTRKAPFPSLKSPHLNDSLDFYSHNKID